MFVVVSTLVGGLTPSNMPCLSVASSWLLLAITIYRIAGIFRTINFAVFVDFTATSKINPQKSYYSIQMQ